MTGHSFDSTVGRERGRLHRLARSNPGVVYMGHETGQLALHLDPPVDGVHRALVTATTLPPIGKRVAPYYHAVVHRWTDEGVPDQRREVYRHPFPALDRIHELVPDFDLLETVLVGGSTGPIADGPDVP